ncbi:MAG: 2-isopropylmalate synthase [Rhizobiales bacterium]|nr:2-isopropylmalate synthase [Hyphomicrobiales bacterium]NRB14623.1 2-isopropylmalate synthase [Hyphomicrobiales bacterium]
MNNKFEKYAPHATPKLTDRTWPDKVITTAPIWCAVDLRDGNQALVNPMNHERKMKMYNLLLSVGFKEIEIGFPSASEIEFNFARHIIENNLIPDDVVPQVLVQAREHLIEKTFAAMEGARKVIVHLYNSTSVAQRRDVFKKSAKEIAELACEGTRLVQKYCAKYPDTEWVFEYSPESFTGTELEVAADVCNAVIETWQPTPEHKMIINLPATVELTSPNIFADQIEWMGRHLARRDSIVLSVHTHNDRGGAEASTELAILAGADRVEGTLLGNGERTGNADLITLGLNLFTQGVDPKLNFDNLPEIVKIVEECNQMDTHPRHPYAGELVFTALSGSHQDAIKKGLHAHQTEQRNHWDVPYLPLDPNDIGRSYETTIRINSQSGKSGIAYILETRFGYKPPKSMQIEFARVIQKIADETAQEILPEHVWNAFSLEYLDQANGYTLKSFNYHSVDESGEKVGISAKIVSPQGDEVEIIAEGSGPINAFANGFRQQLQVKFNLRDYEEHTLSSGSGALAAAYISLVSDAGAEFYGVGQDSDVIKASIKGLLSAYNRMK